MITKMMILLLALTFSEVSSNFLKDPVYPVDKATPNQKKLALDQTTRARNVLYQPNSVIVDLISQLSEKLLKLSQELDFEKLKDGTRVLDTNGFIEGKSLEDLQRILNRLIEKKGDSNDRVTMMNLLGDVGTALLDYSPNNKTIVANAALKIIGKDQSYLTETYIKNLKKAKNVKVGPNKKKSDPIERKDGNFSQRKGILEKGEAADKNLISIRKDSSINGAKWPKQLIEETRLNTQEPWAGHMSGSIVEVLAAMDLFTGEDPLKPYPQPLAKDSKLNTPARQAKAALASSWLIAVGFHSALEVYDTVKAYLGDDLRLSNTIQPTQDLGHISDTLTPQPTEFFMDFFKGFIASNKLVTVINDSKKRLKK